MARSRIIKPGFFTNEQVGENSPIGRLLFIGMWMIADFRGNLEWREKALKVRLLPYDDCDIKEIAINLDKSGLIRFYSDNHKMYVNIPNFERHQSPHKNERDKGSDVPIYDNNKRQAVDLKGLTINPDKSGSLREYSASDPAICYMPFAVPCLPYASSAPTALHAESCENPPVGDDDYADVLSLADAQDDQGRDQGGIYPEYCAGTAGSDPTLANQPFGSREIPDVSRSCSARAAHQPTEYPPESPQSALGLPGMDDLMQTNAKVQGITENAPQDKSGPIIDVQAVADLYNEILGESLRSVRSITDMRRKHVIARTKEQSKRRGKDRPADLEWWRDYFEFVSDSDFLMGRSGTPGRPWQCDFDWLINPNNMIKIIEHKYHAES